MSGVFHRVERVSLPLTGQTFSERIDVRSPKEFAEDHMSGAVNLPVLSDEERVEVGTIYCQESPFRARKIGAAYVMANISRHLSGHFAAKEKDYTPLVYCWRGGQRSRVLALILSEIGWSVRVLEGGYKAYRRHVLHSLAEHAPRLRLRVLNGLTGSGKTLILTELARRGEQVLDLEGLAEHRGSLFGGSFASPQPTQKRFETRIHDALGKFDLAKRVFVEAESPKIGQLCIPTPLWRAMQGAEVAEISSPLEDRARYVAQEYEEWRDRPEAVMAVIDKLRRMHSRESITAWESLAGEKAGWPELVRQLLRDHYDPRYGRDGTGRYAAPTENFTWTNHDIEALGRLADEIISRLPQ